MADMKVTSVSWSAPTLPTGLSINNSGVISGTPTVVGDTDVPITVTTNYGSDTKNIHISVKSLVRFHIYTASGTDKGEFSMSDIQRMLRDGEIGGASGDYSIGAYLTVPYTDPVDNTEYALPFFFGTKRAFTLEDGTTFTGLGLQAQYGLPTGNIQFDAPEPSNPMTSPDAYRKSNGNNRWSVANLRQFMNSHGTNWYSAQHAYDAAPTTPNPATAKGLLDCFPSQFIDALAPVQRITKPIAADNSGTDTTYDTMFPLSMSEMNCKVTNASIGLNDETEGAFWEYWRQKTGKNDYDSGNNGNNGGLAANSNRIMYAVENHSQAVYVWLRSAYLSYSSYLWYVYSSGYLNYGNAYNTYRVAPACVIKPAA